MFSHDFINWIDAEGDKISQHQQMQDKYKYKRTERVWQGPVLTGQSPN